MNYKIIFTCLLIFACLSLQAQNDKLRVAIFDPTSSGAGIDDGTRIAVREIISSTFVNTRKYTIVERSLIERVMQEQKFSNSGAVDDSQASEIGKLLGANKIVLSVVTLAGGRNMLSLKLVDVNTASVEKQKTQVVDANKLLDFVEPMTLGLMGEKSTAGAQQTQVSVAENNPTSASPVVSQTTRKTSTTVGSTESKIIFGVRAGLNFPFGTGSANSAYSEYTGKYGFEVGPVLYYYPLKNNFYINTGVMIGLQNYDYYHYYWKDDYMTSDYWSSSCFNFYIPVYAGYNFSSNKSGVGLFAQAGAYLGNMSDFDFNAGLAIMTGVNIKRFKIEAGFQIGLAGRIPYVAKFSLGASYAF